MCISVPVHSTYPVRPIYIITDIDTRNKHYSCGHGHRVLGDHGFAHGWGSRDVLVGTLNVVPIVQGWKAAARLPTPCWSDGVLSITGNGIHRHSPAMQ